MSLCSCFVPRYARASVSVGQRSSEAQRSAACHATLAAGTDASRPGPRRTHSLKAADEASSFVLRSSVHPMAGAVHTFRGEVLQGALRLRSRALRRLARPLLLGGSRVVERIPGVGVRVLPKGARAGQGGRAVTEARRTSSSNKRNDRPTLGEALARARLARSADASARISKATLCVLAVR
jgi:hypothetical protein